MTRVGRGAAGRRRAWVAAVVGALTAVPLIASVPAAGAAETAASAIVAAGSATTAAWVDDDTNATMTWTGNRRGVYLTGDHADGSNDSYGWFFSPNDAADLPTSGEHPVSSNDGPLALLFSDGSGSCLVSGTVTVLELSFAGDGTPTSLAVDWTGSCNGVPHGQVRVGSTVPYGGIDVPASVEFGTVTMGEIPPATPVVIRGHGTQAPAITSVEVGHAPETDPQYVTVYQGDGCSGVTLGHLQTCSVQLRPAFTKIDGYGSGSHPLLVTAGGATGRTLLRHDGAWVSQRGQFTPLSDRVMDTRSGTGVRKGVVGAGQTVTLKIAGKGIIPSTGTSAAVLNLTVTGSTRSGYVTAYPAGTTRPTASNINFRAGFTGANLVTVPIGANGSVTFYNATGSVHLVADLVGIYAKDRVAPLGRTADFYQHDPSRLFDSRTAWGERLGPHEYFPLVADYGAETNGRVEALVVNVTATGTTGSGVLSAVQNEPEYGPPTTSTLNYTKGLTAANMAVVQRAPNSSSGLEVPTFWIANTGNASTHVIVDIVGYFAQGTIDDPGFRFQPLAPTRVVDTRSDLGLASIGKGVAKRVQASRAVAGRDTYALVGNLTGIVPSTSTHLTAWGGGTVPGVSNLNLMTGVTRANSVWPGLDEGNGFRLQNAVGTLDVAMDITGTFEIFPPFPETIAGVPFPPLQSAGARSAAPAPDREAPTEEGPRPAKDTPTASAW
ncbi:hypothetical protein [Oryzobacter telluris]|uniref:hypothetical protein n=1 Tax=Oryzobacter telluris TaxID=3149179 RepID=UPI00370DBDFC